MRYDGPAGRYPILKLGDLPDAQPPPLVFAAIGPKSLQLAGAHFDGVLLHPFLTAEAVARSATVAREAAAAAGRDPAAVRVCATVVVAPDLTPDEEEAVVGGRAVTYFQIPSFGEQLAEWRHDRIGRVHGRIETPHAVEEVEEERAVVAHVEVLQLEGADAVFGREGRLGHPLHRELLRRIGHMLGARRYQGVIIAAAQLRR